MVRLGRLLEPQYFLHHEEVDQHDKRGVVVLALPTATIVVTQPKALLAVPEALFDRSAQAGQPHQPRRGHRRGAVA